MIKIMCDRCGRECVNNEYYTINIQKHYINSNDLTIAYVNNTKTKHYCEKCKKEIELFCLNNGIVTEDKCVNCRQAIDCINGLLDGCMYGE